VALTFGASSQTTPVTSDEIFLTQIPNMGNQFEVLPLLPSRRGAYFTHLWWSGDNSFSFAASPTHNHITPGSVGVSTDYLMTDITTENYGTGGPPPLTYSFTTQSMGGDYRKILSGDTTIFVQAYRNAVIDDTMYLIITYANPLNGDALTGQIKLDVGPHAEIWWSTLSKNRHFLPNGETWNASTQTIDFIGMPPSEERSILIPVKINSNEEDALEMRVDYIHPHNTNPGGEIGTNYFPISPAVAHSHDPNLMLEHSDVKTHCDYRGGNIHYTVKFQNEGSGPTKYVRVVCHFDDKVDLHKITGIKVPKYFQGVCRTDNNIRMTYDKSVGAIHSIDYVKRTLTIEMHHLILETINDSDVPFLDMTRDQIEFDILVSDNYLFGPPVLSYSEIFFDREAAIITNIAKTGCASAIPLDAGGGFQCKDLSFICKYKWWFVGGMGLLLLLIILLLLRRRKRNQKEGNKTQIAE
jgi:hypothetical protein